MKFRTLVLGAALVAGLFSTPHFAQSLEGQVVEDFQATVTYTLDLNAPPAPNGLFVNVNFQFDALQFTAGSVLFQGQPIDFSGTEAAWLTSSHGGPVAIGGPPLPVPQPLRLGGLGEVFVGGPAGNMQGDLRLAGMDFGPNLGPGFFPLIVDRPFVQIWQFVDWNSPAVPELQPFLVTWAFEVIPTFVDPNNGIVQAVVNGQILVDLLPEISNVRLQQVNWLDPEGNVLAADSNWGLLEFDLVPHPCLPFFLNVVADAGSGPVWIVQNFPLFPPLPPLPLDPLPLPILPPILGQGVDVDLGGLVPPDPHLSGLELQLQVLSRPGDPPPIFEETIQIPVDPLFREASGSKFPDAVPIGTDVGAPAGIRVNDFPRNVIRHQGVPGVQEDKDHCLAGSFARSIAWLNTTYGLGADKTVDQIYDDLKAAGVSSAGTDYVTDVAAKAAYLKNTFHSDAQTKILDLGNAIGPVTGVPETTGVDLAEWLRTEMKTEAVELHYDTHIVTLTEYWETGEGAEKKIFVKYRDDKKQGNPGLGDTHERTAELTRNPDGTYSFRDRLQVLSFKVQAAISESVPVVLGLALNSDDTLSLELTSGPDVFETYDVVTGSIHDLPLGSGHPCLRNAVPITELPLVLDLNTVGPAEFFLIRPQTHDGPASANALGTGQSGDRDALFQCPTCAHDPLMVGVPLDPICDANVPGQSNATGCVDNVCSVFPSCCEMIWDPFCVSQAKFACASGD